MLANRVKTTTNISLSKILSDSALTPALCHTHVLLTPCSQLKQVGPQNHIAFHTEHADTSTAPRASLWCCVDYVWHEEEEEEDSFPAAEQVGMQLLLGWKAGQQGEGGWERSSAALLNFKSGKVMSQPSSQTTSRLSLFFPSAEWKRGWRGRNEEDR